MATTPGRVLRSAFSCLSLTHVPNSTCVDDRSFHSAAHTCAASRFVLRQAVRTHPHRFVGSAKMLWRVVNLQTPDVSNVPEYVG